MQALFCIYGNILAHTFGQLIEILFCIYAVQKLNPTDFHQPCLFTDHLQYLTCGQTPPLRR